MLFRSGVAIDPDIVRFTDAPTERAALQASVDEQLDNLKATHRSAGIFFVLD